ncbi:protein kinase [Nonomuraea sp. NPDC000554]|uniref:protein kinase domain-containing protein n=1 Tax=Nonomuraea sp. NPDC000554 TaxID=3154259 RepID=UPI00333229B2
MGETGKLADRYRLLNPLGGGAVRLAFDEVTHRDVAVRQLREPAEAHEAALAAARRAAALRHPSVVQILDVVAERGELWLVMEFVSGPSLEQAVLSRHPLPVLQTARVGVCLLGALLAAHAAGIIHGRVNPGTVLLTTTGRAVLSGFGFAHHPGLRASADLWSLAATLHFAVEGRPPGLEPAAATDPLRSLIRAMLDPSGPPSTEVVAETLARLAVTRSLDQVIAASGPMPPAQVAAVGLDVLEQLAELHLRGTSHGGVQPANVMLGADGHATLAPPLATGVQPAFTAPERVVSPAADLWSLGATLFAAVEGRPPAPGAPLTRAGALAPALFRLLAGNPAYRPTLDSLRQELHAAADPGQRV